MILNKFRVMTIFESFLKTTYIKKGGEITYVKQQYFEFKNLLEKCKLDAENIYQLNNLYGKRILKFLNHSSTFLI